MEKLQALAERAGEQHGGESLGTRESRGIAIDALQVLAAQRVAQRGEEHPSC
jgi:hypothetical protein